MQLITRIIIIIIKKGHWQTYISIFFYNTYTHTCTYINLTKFFFLIILIPFQKFKSDLIFD